MHGNLAAVRKYSQQLEFTVSGSTVRGFKKNVKAMLDRSEFTPDQLCYLYLLDVTTLHLHLRLGGHHSWVILNRSVMKYIKALRFSGGVVNSAILVGIVTVCKP